MTAKWVRLWFVATGICVAAGVILSVITAVHNQQGHSHSGVERGFNTFSFFAIQSNLIVGATSLLLATNGSGLRLFLGRVLPGDPSQAQNFRDVAATGRIALAIDRAQFSRLVEARNGVPIRIDHL